MWSTVSCEFLTVIVICSPYGAKIIKQFETICCGMASTYEAMVTDKLTFGGIVILSVLNQETLLYSSSSHLSRRPYTQCLLSCCGLSKLNWIRSANPLTKPPPHRSNRKSNLLVQLLLLLLLPPTNSPPVSCYHSQSHANGK